MTNPSRLTDHFSLAEVEHSETAARLGYDNKLPPELLFSVMSTAAGMERVRSALGNRPVTITSWYRSLLTNSALGSKPSSQHLKAEAVDFICPAFGSPLMICRVLTSTGFHINFDQLILEHTWVHISFNSIPGAEQRNEVLSLLETGKYAHGLTDKKGDQL